MATTDYTGAPNARIKLNNTGAAAGSVFTVFDTTSAATKMTVEADTGDVTVTGTIQKSGIVELYNSAGSGTELVDIYQNAAIGGKTKRIQFGHDASGSLANMKASTSGYAMQVEGDTVDLNTSNASGTVVKFKTSGTSRLTMEYTSSKPRFTAATSMDYEVTGATSDLNVLAGEHITLKFGVSTSGECRFLNGTGTTLTKSDESGIWTWNDTAGAAEAKLTPKDANNDAVLELGIGDTVRGKAVLKRDSTNGALRPGVLVLEADDGTPIFLCSAKSGANYYLYLCATDPGTSPTTHTQIPYAAT